MQRVQNPEAVIRRYFTKQAFLKKIRTSAGVSFVIKLLVKSAILLKKRLQLRCLPMNFTKSLRLSI